MLVLSGKKLFCGAAVGDGLAVGGDQPELALLHASGAADPLVLHGHNDYVNSIVAAPTPNGTHLLASASCDGTVALRRVKSIDAIRFDCSLERVLKGHRGPCRSVCFLDDAGTLLASAGGHGDLSVRIWHTAGQTRSHVLTCLRGGQSKKRPLLGHTAPIESVLRVTDSLLASASLDETVRLWDVEALCATHVLRGHRREALALCANYPLLLSSSDDRTIRVWDCRSMETVQILRGAHSGSVYAVEMITPDVCVSGGADGKLAAYDLRKNGKGPMFSQEHAHGIRACNKILVTKPLSLGGAEVASLWSFGDDGCMRSWLCGSSSFAEITPHNGEASAVLGTCRSGSEVLLASAAHDMN